MTVQSMQDMVDENLRRVTGWLERREQRLPQVVDDRIKCSMRPNESVHWSRLVGIGNSIQSSLRDIQHQGVEGVGQQNCRLLL